MQSVRSLGALRLGLLLAASLVVVACEDGSSGDPEEMGSSDTDDVGGTDDVGDTDEVGDTEAAIDPGPWESLEERPCPPDSFLTYDNFGGPYMLTYCTGCHGTGVPADQRQNAPTAINFDDVESVRQHADRIWVRAADQNATMPPAGAPGDEERALLGEWLACGAP